MTILVETVARAIKYGLSVSVSPFGDPLVEDHDDAARAAIAAIEGAGYRIVPVEPTEQMISDGKSELYCHWKSKRAGSVAVARIYSDMLDAAPKVVP